MSQTIIIESHKNCTDTQFDTAPSQGDNALPAITNTAGSLDGAFPLARLQSQLFTKFEDICSKLSMLISEGTLRMEIEKATLVGEREWQRACTLLTMISVAYVNGNSTTDPLLTLLPDNLSGPWIEISKHFDFEPVLNYASSVQFNWHSPTKKDINSVKLEDIEICSTITGSLTEVWFYQVSLAIELESIRIVPIIKNIFSILNSNHNEAKEKIEVQLGNLLNSLKEIGMLLERIHEHCVPSVFYNGLRPYLSGWNTPGFDKMGGLKFGSAPDAPIYTSTGGSAAQSPLIQVLDALFGVRHLPNPDGSPNYLYLIRKYMPKADRDLILWVESWGEGFKDFCVENQIYHPFIDCLSQMISNRQLHGGIVWKFIKQEAMKLKKDTEAVGTGGTPYEKFLKSIIGSTQMLKDAFQKKFAILHN